MSGNYGHNKPQSAGGALRVVLALCFMAFSFCYIYILQPDLLAYMQHVLSKGSTAYNRLIGSLIVLALVFIIHAAVASASRLPAKLYSLTFIPSAVFLGVLTDLIVEYSAAKLAAYLLLSLLSVILCVRPGNAKAGRRGGHEPGTVFICNALTLSAIMVALGLCGNSNDEMHFELKMQRLLNEGKYAEAAGTGGKSLTASGRMTRLRAYALSRQGLLGEKMFEYPVVSDRCGLLFPRADSAYMIFHPDNLYRYIGAFPERTSSPYRFLHLVSTRADVLASHPQIKDYLLITALMRKEIDLFADEIRRFYDFSSPGLALPKHYSEALVLYSHLRTKPAVTYNDTITETNYKDFIELGKKYTDKGVRKNVLRRQYGDTYWWFFYYGGMRG